MRCPANNVEHEKIWGRVVVTNHVNTVARRALILLSIAMIDLPAQAQEVVATSELQEVIVTARKRQESILDVPVVETAITQRELEQFHTQDLKDVATLVPGLSFGDSVLSTGTQVSIRGVGTSELDPGVDASVSLNIDGLQLSQGLAYRSGLFDTAQVEVLKGPQSLFYGKSSPGGVISIRTADPTDKVELIAQGGYEFEARERQGELIASGPISDTLKVRLAAQYDAQDGFYDNVATAAPGLGGRNPNDRIGPDENYTLRGTVLWNPVEQLSARLKVNQAHDRDDYAGIEEFGLCPQGTGTVPGFFIPFLSPKDDCKINRSEALVALDPAAFPGISNNGTPFLETTQTYGTLELNYGPWQGVTFTSVTGYYLLHSSSLYNTQAEDAGPFLAVTNAFQRREVTEEVRANSDFSGPINFTLGGFLERGQFADRVVFFANQDLGLPLPAILQNGIQTVDITTDSLFGQLRYKILPKLELAAGIRWTDEIRNDTPLNLLSGTPVLVPIAVDKIRSSNYSPELTVTYEAASDLTYFGSLKRGFKSGSFDVATPALPGEDNAFGDERVEGGELGMKSRWLDHRLAFDLAAYDYHYSGLQVGANVPASDGVIETRTVNAGAAIVYGVESDIAYRPLAVEGLGLHVAANWNHARFRTLNDVPCYGGQTVAQGCNELFDPTANSGAGGFTAQNRSGLPLIRAPDWETNFGFDYQLALGAGMNLSFNSSTQYSSKYLADLGYVFYQPSFFKTNFGVTLQGRADRWEVAVIGKDLNNALTYGNCANANTAAGLLGGQTTGGNASGPAGPDQVGCYMDRGREVWFQLTWKPFN
jgi:iron complex outermembrane receptor protein